MAAAAELVAATLEQNRLDSELLRWARKGVLHKVQKLHQAGANIHSVDLLGWNALHCVCCAACSPTKWRAAASDVLSISTSSAATARLKVVSYLLEQGVDANLPDRKLAQTPLHKAAARDDLEAAELLVRHGANTRLLDKNASAPGDLVRNSVHHCHSPRLAQLSALFQVDPVVIPVANLFPQQLPWNGSVLVSAAYDDNLALQLQRLQRRDLSPEDYDLLLRLDESIAPKTLSPEAVAMLSQTVNTSFGVCVVCQEERQEGDQVIQLPCGHEFHAACIFQWLTTSSDRCPLDGAVVSPN